MGILVYACICSYLAATLGTDRSWLIKRLGEDSCNTTGCMLVFSGGGEGRGGEGVCMGSRRVQ